MSAKSRLANNVVLMLFLPFNFHWTLLATVTCSLSLKLFIGRGAKLEGNNVTLYSGRTVVHIDLASPQLGREASLRKVSAVKCTRVI